ncbi:hypothetical protein Lfu02_14720 [Longispora fulva]|uniref:Uncharacterized protein n=1 Tax=Longispora fulva TaxID=619741 RepID=A0A8J7H2V5_9ACTN|nr:hypothetical protein [Longispora fulva]MBG6140518.1 hypothetical protein [Longispora fulva]GIG57100.1 hypothetical protein Lfu02_14720 [Longispora fulva]
MTKPRHLRCEGAELVPAADVDCGVRATTTIAGHCPNGHYPIFDLCDAHAVVLSKGQVTCEMCSHQNDIGVPVTLDRASAPSENAS